MGVRHHDPNQCRLHRWKHIAIEKMADEAALCEEVVQPTVIAAAEEEDHSMQEERDAAAAEVFAGYSLQSADIRFRGPRSGGKVRGELMLCCVCTCHLLNK